MTEDRTRAVPLIAEGPGRQLAAEFAWQDDRYRHTIVAGRGGQTGPVLSSCDGSSEDVWPVSPPFQQLSMEGEGDSRVALLVGMAGKSHWSAGVETDSPLVMLRFDVACLLRQPPVALSSCYHLHAATHLRSRYEAVIDCETGPVEVVTGAPEGCPRPELELESDRLTIVAELPVNGPLPRTVRWQYTLHMPG